MIFQILRYKKIKASCRKKKRARAKGKAIKNRRVVLLLTTGSLRLSKAILNAKKK